MTKPEIITMMSEISGETKKASGVHLDAFLKVLEQAVQTEQEINLIGYFKLSTIKREARIGRNPKTGEVIDIPPRKVLKFKIGNNLVKLVNN